MSGEAQSRFNTDHVVRVTWLEPETWQTPWCTFCLHNQINQQQWDQTMDRAATSTSLPLFTICFFFFFFAVFFICSRLWDCGDVGVCCSGHEYDTISRIQIEMECTRGWGRNRTGVMNHNYLVQIRAKIPLEFCTSAVLRSPNIINYVALTNILM